VSLLQAYHGTEHTFESFDLGQCGKASGVNSNYLYFTSSRENALFYGPVVLTVDLAIYHPLIVENASKPVREYADDAVLSNYHNDTEYDGVIVRDVVDGTHYSDIFVIFEAEQARIVEREDTSTD
jgi:hypothetical protein